MNADDISAREWRKGKWVHVRRGDAGEAWGREPTLWPVQTTHLKCSRIMFSKQLNNSGYTSHAMQETQV